MAEPAAHENLDLLAAEYVLGVLDANERREARTLIDGNGTMRMLAELWQERLAPLNEAYAAVAVPDVWPALDRQLFAERRTRNRIFWFAVAGLALALAVKLAFWLWMLL
jgi:anti-sigma-K factor RskA